jgi:cell volume regulation protein A
LGADVNDVVPFGVVLCLAALTLLGAVLSNRVSEWVRVPAPGIFLILSAVASDVFHGLGSLSIKVDQRIVTVALIFILFEGGMHIGWGRFRSAAGAVVWLGVVGTFLTAAALALAAQGLFGLGWRASLLIGTALAPTDPAVVFSVLGRREVSGRSGTLLQGESGANDPVGIALMVSILGAAGGGWGDVLGGVGEFALQMAVGIAIGAIGGYALLKVMRLPLPNEALYPVRTIAVGVLIYGVAAVCHGSGFLAVFLAGILIGDARAPYKREVERFAGALSSLGEIVAFTTLGLTISLHDVFHGGDLWTGLVLAALMILAVRPVCLGLLLVPIKLDLGERIFVLWSGLKGAVPILLGTFVLSEGVDHASRIYNIIFIAVTVSVIVQGGLVPTAARLLHVPMRVVEPEPWALGLRFRDEPEGIHRYLVAAGSPADGCTIGDLAVGDAVWISIVNRGGRLIHVNGQTVLQAGDEVLALADKDAELDGVFTRPQQWGE